MKKIRFILIVLITGTIIMFSCNKKNEDSAAQEGKMSTIMDGKSVSFNVKALHSKTTNSEMGPYESIELTGTNVSSTSDSTWFQLWINALTINSRRYNAFGVGTGSGIITAYYETVSRQNKYYMGYTGDSLKDSKNVITVESITNNYIKGTYNFTLVNGTDNSKTIATSGSFYALITEVQN